MAQDERSKVDHYNKQWCVGRGGGGALGAGAPHNFGVLSHMVISHLNNC